jgi:hypothetical protein
MGIFYQTAEIDFQYAHFAKFHQSLKFIINLFIFIEHFWELRCHVEYHFLL